MNTNISADVEGAKQAAADAEQSAKDAAATQLASYDALSGAIHEGVNEA